VCVTTRGRVLRWAWLVIATIMACGGLGVCLEAKDDGERYLNPTSLSLYLGVVILLAAVAYAIYRVLVREPPDTARRRAALDALLAGVVTGPALLLVIVLAATIRDCSFGTGC
jgi:multisubunit Na+/H+ antiporter MnhF subunit